MWGRGEKEKEKEVAGNKERRMRLREERPDCDNHSALGAAQTKAKAGGSEE